jgi:hypothetical protein
VFTATIDPEDTVAELNEDDNSLQIIVQLEAKPEGFLSSIKVPAMWTGFGLVLALISLVAIRRYLYIEPEPFSEELEEEKETQVISGPPPPSASQPMPRPVAITQEPGSSISSTDIASASKALDGLLNEVKENEGNVDSSSIPVIGSRVADWKGLKWVGEYQYDEDGTWFSGADCGRWKQDDDGGFTRIE